MVENLAESPGISSDGPGSARIKIPKEGAFSLREGKKEREEGPSFSFGTRREAANLSPSRLGSHWHAAGTDSPRRPRGQSARSVDGPRGAWTVRTQGADGPLKLTERPEMHLLPTSRADGRDGLADSPRGPAGRSGLPPRTIRPPLLILT
jgi:hypothetical protein